MVRNNVKVQKILASQSSGDAEMMKNMFDQMLGISDAEVDILMPKYEKLVSHISKFIQVYDVLVNFQTIWDLYPEYSAELNEIKIFIAKLKQWQSTILPSDKLALEDKAIINKEYKKLLDNNLINGIISTSNRLQQYTQHLADVNNTNDIFIKREPGLSMIILTFSELDFKHIWSNTKTTDTVKKFLMSILYHTRAIGCEIEDISMSPNIDIKQFSSVLINNIDALQKQPGLDRCQDAFRIIANSVRMLENNFKSYYRDSLEASNPSIILENFIVDVSMQKASGSRVKYQFKRIIEYMRTAAEKNNNPQVKKLYAMLNNKFKQYDKSTADADSNDKKDD